MSAVLNRLYQAFFVKSVPPPHPASYAATHFVPGVKRFLTEGDGFPSLAQLSSLGGIKQWYALTDPLQSSFAFCAAITTFLWAVSEITNNSSWVDRFWAILPVFYSAHFVFHEYAAPNNGITKKLFAATQSKTLFTFLPDSVDERMFLVFMLQVLWSLRLHGNSIRRDFFNFSTEDYRWPILRKKLSWFQYRLFTIFFIAIAQNLLLAAPGLFQYILLTAHTDVHPTHPYPALGWPDFVIAGLFVATLVIEQIADSQQQSYQNWKHGELKRRQRGKGNADKPSYVQSSTRNEAALQRGFTTDGLWAWSRHPNFLCEQTTWYLLYLFTLRATIPPAVGTALYDGFRTAVNRQSFAGIGTLLERAAPHLLNYSFWMPVAMSLIFIGSSPLTEDISSSKYPLYKQYQRRVAMFLPLETLFVKLPWLTLTGARSEVNQDVFGSRPSPRAIEAGKKRQ